MTMPPGVLAEMARQILDLLPQRAEQLNRRVVEVEADVAQVALERLLRIDPLELVHHLREPIDLRRFERQRLADFARGAAAAIGDDVRGHRHSRPRRRSSPESLSPDP